MRARLLAGKTIRKVHQALVDDTSGRKQWSLEAIEFTDGSWLRFVVIEGEGEYGIAAVYPARDAQSS